MKKISYYALLFAGTAIVISAMSFGRPGAERVSSGPREGGLRVGYGRADITPALGTPCALGLDDKLVEVFDPLYVRGLWVELEGRKALVLAVDVIGFTSGDTDEFSAEIEKAVGISREEVIICATHTHQTANSRWEVGKLLAPYGLEEEFVSSKFKEVLIRGLLEAARQAKASAVPCEMAYSEFPVKDIASNRRLPVEGGKVVFRSSRPPADLRAKPEGKIDPLLRAVFFRSLKDGALTGVLNYNCHPSAAGGDEGPYATGDFPGRGMAIAEKEIGNLKLLHLTGTSGEINPGKHVLNDSLAPADRKRDVQLMGQRYSEAIIGAVRGVKSWQPAGRLELARVSFDLTLQKNVPTLAEVQKKLAAAVEEYKKDKALGKTQPAKVRGLYEGYAILHSRNGQQMTQAAALRVGDVFFAFHPGEIMLKFGEELRDDFARPLLLNVSCAFDNGISYVVPQVYFDEGGYEPTATRLAPEAYDELKGKMIELLKSVGLAQGKT